MPGDRVLIVLDDSFDAPGVDVPQWARVAVQDAGEVHVIAPYIGSRLSVATDDDEPRHRASRRLKATMDHLTSVGIHPAGSVSDYSPLDAVTSYLLEHEVDRIVLAVTADGNWREKGLIDKVRNTTNAVVQALPVVSA